MVKATKYLPDTKTVKFYNSKGSHRITIKFTHLYFFLLSVVISGCTLTPTHEKIASENQWQITKLESDLFEHIVISKPRLGDGPLFVFIEGDGRPWIMRHIVSDDPTPSKILTLNFMKNTPFDSIFIGRPCYFGLAETKNCSKKFWTSHRYSPEIITSMAEIINKVRLPSQTLTIVGHSGGGSIATLLATKIPPPLNIITIAANLDTDAWVRLHGYHPLHGSLNPISHAIPEEILHIHFAGGKDTNIPAKQIKSFTERHNGRYWIQPTFDHACCWSKEWDTILKILEMSKRAGV